MVQGRAEPVHPTRLSPRAYLDLLEHVFQLEIWKSMITLWLGKLHLEKLNVQKIWFGFCIHAEAHTLRREEN